MKKIESSTSLKVSIEKVSCFDAHSPDALSSGDTSPWASPEATPTLEETLKEVVALKAGKYRLSVPGAITELASTQSRIMKRYVKSGETVEVEEVVYDHATGFQRGRLKKGSCGIEEGGWMSLSWSDQMLVQPFGATGGISLPAACKAMILCFAFGREEAEAKLANKRWLYSTRQDGIEHCRLFGLISMYKNEFIWQKGVTVRGAGTLEANGWYEQYNPSDWDEPEDIPDEIQGVLWPVWSDGQNRCGKTYRKMWWSQLRRYNGHYYQKDDGYHMFYIRHDGPRPWTLWTLWAPPSEEMDGREVEVMEFLEDEAEADMMDEDLAGDLYYAFNSSSGRAIPPEANWMKGPKGMFPLPNLSGDASPVNRGGDWDIPAEDDSDSWDSWGEI